MVRSKHSWGESGTEGDDPVVAVGAPPRLHHVPLADERRQARSTGRRAGRWRSPAGVSVMQARPMFSIISEKPGPEVTVITFWPPQAAPIRAAIEAISSSIWMKHAAHEGDALGEALRRLGGGRDRIAGEEAATGGQAPFGEGEVAVEEVGAGQDSLRVGCVTSFSPFFLLVLESHEQGEFGADGSGRSGSSSTSLRARPAADGSPSC